MSQFTNDKDEVRYKMVELFDTIMQNKRTSQKIEQSIYNYIIQESKKKNISRKWSNNDFKDFYSSKIRSIYSNLKTDSYIQNKSFLERINSGKIKAEEIGTLSVYDIHPDNWINLLNMKSKRDKIKYKLKPEAMTNLFKCRKCGSRETSYYEVQTRSADEPMTQFITCLKCESRWKQ
tara:strand:- start:4610 stop:5140 length:531 start_codon:yes stop_codon:yes gene_type:complete